MIKEEWDTGETPNFNKREQARIARTPKPQPQYSRILYDDLHSANPILPPGVHNDNHDAYLLRVTHKSFVEKEGVRLNKTLLPQMGIRSWANQASKLQNNINTTSIFKDKFKSPILSNEQFTQYSNIIANKRMIYSRFNNKDCNKIEKGQPGIFCSVFINFKKIQVKSRKTPIFEYLSKLYQSMKPSEPAQDALQFHSDFQSANLLYAFNCPLEAIPTYELYMHNDINTKGSTQWFYFSATAQKRTKVKFRIMNFYKTSSLYSYGMKILISQDQQDWKRIGTAIKYKSIQLSDGKETYCLQFICQMQKPQKKYYFSFALPYPTHKLQQALQALSQLPLYPKICQKVVLCQTYLGNHCYMLTITNKIRQKSSKPIIYIIARQHPGETPASFVVEGLTQTLLTNRIQMNQLRERFILKVVPMINVDGVINGNYRTNFSGKDLNRQWLEPSKKFHSQIYYLKKEIINNKKNVHFFLDIHAHSRKMNSFFYGSGSIDLSNQLYSFVCSRLNKHISYEECVFSDDPSKKSTARVTLENQASIKKSLTFQTSFYGFQDKQKNIRSHFKEEHLKSLGETLALGFYYSQIGIQKVDEKLKECNKKQQNIKNNMQLTTIVLTENNKKKGKQDIMNKVEKNCIRLHQKWAKEIQLLKNNKKNSDAVSEGSSLDPERFQLSEVQQIKVPYTLQSEGLNITMPNLKQKYEGHRIHHQQKLQAPSKIQEKSQYLQERDNLIKKQDEFNRLMQIQHNALNVSNLRNSLIIKKLESDIKNNKYNRSRRYESAMQAPQRNHLYLASKQRAIKNQVIRGERFLSLEVGSQDDRNYRNSIIQLRKALAYFVSSKNTGSNQVNYEEYKKEIKYTTIDNLDNRSIKFKKHKV